VELYDSSAIGQRYEQARSFYRTQGVDTDAAIESLNRLPLSLHCWQGDDVHGFTDPDAALSGGIQVTGSYPGRARNADELRKDLETVFSVIPGPLRLNLHAIYAETGGKDIPRDELDASHFAGWVAWAKKMGIALDFNPTLFSHPKAAEGLTLSHPDQAIRDFWIRHCRASRRIGEYFGKELGSPCVTNIWIPDGFKDIPGNRLDPRKRLEDSLDQIFSERIDERYNIDAVESKVFGIGSEAYVAGSHEFYLGYGLTRDKMICLDMGHFHPTESVADKISSILQFSGSVLLHLSRPVRWDSDHVVILDSALEETAREIVRYCEDYRVFLALDFFDASVNRLVAWAVGARNVRKALLFALLDPRHKLDEASSSLDYTRQLLLFEESKTWPRIDVWNQYCMLNSVPPGSEWSNGILQYEQDELSLRGKR
jgi:L-rhamnose isomerase